MAWIHTGKWFPFVPSWSIHIWGLVESSLMNVCWLVWPERQRHNFCLHASGHILLELHAMISTKCSGLIRPLSLAGCITFTTGVKDGDNQCGFVCFTCLLHLFFFKGQCLRMPLCEEMHALYNPKNRWDAAEPGLHCMSLLLHLKDSRYYLHINHINTVREFKDRGKFIINNR